QRAPFLPGQGKGLIAHRGTHGCESGLIAGEIAGWQGNADGLPYARRGAEKPRDRGEILSSGRGGRSRERCLLPTRGIARSYDFPSTGQGEGCQSLQARRNVPHGADFASEPHAFLQQGLRLLVIALRARDIPETDEGMDDAQSFTELTENRQPL